MATLSNRFHLILLAAALAWSRPAEAQIDLRWDADDGLYTANDDGDTITWPSGTYYMGSDSGTLYSFILHPLDPVGPRRPRTNLTINAWGVTIVVTDPALSAFLLHQCHGLIINGLTITYDPLPYNQSTVIAVSTANDTVDVQLDSGYLGFEDPFFSYGPSAPLGHRNYGVLFDPSTELPKAGTNNDFLLVDSYQALVGSSVYRLYVNPQFHAYLTHFAIGDRFVYVGRRLGINVFNLNGFEPTGAPHNRPPVTLESCSAHAATSLFINLRSSPNISSTGQAVVSNCTMSTGTPNRLISGIACLFAANCRTGPLVENCTFERMSDDGLDIHGDARSFMGYPILGNFSFADFDSGPRLAVGDSLQIFFPPTGQVTDVSIIAIDGLAGGPSDEDWRRVELSAPVSGMIVDAINTANTTRAWNLSSACPNAIIRNNIIRNHRHTGIVLNAQGGTVTGNTIDGSAGGGIIAANVYSFLEGKQGPVPRNITIRSNTIKNCGYTAASSNVMGGSSIVVGGMNGIAFNQFASFQTASNMMVEGNTIQSWNTFGIYARALKDSQIRRYLGAYNVFKGAVADASRAVVIGFPAGATNVDGVNTGQANGLDYAVRIDNGVDGNVTATRIIVQHPTLPLEDLR